MKAAEWNPELRSKYRTSRAIGRQRKRWEDDIDEFHKVEEHETENFIESNSQINKTWIHTATDREEDGLQSKTNTQRLQKNDMKIMRG